MCEHFVARADEPFRIDTLWPFTERLERFGIAGFGWGAAWLRPDGRLDSYRNLLAFRDDPAREAVGRNETSSLLVHLRRPSKMSTLTLPDTQPFADPRGRFAFSHNGDLQAIQPWRDRYRAEGRIHGRADTEVGQRWLEDAWPDGSPHASPDGSSIARHKGSPDRSPADGSTPRLLGELHDVFGGHANLAVLAADGSVHHYAGNDENPVFTFRLDGVRLAATGIYSLDRSLFRLVAPGATERRLVPHRTSASFA
jgi:hypothetical protein